MHRTAPFDIPTGARPSEEELVAESAQRVAGGSTPLARMAAPTLSFDNAGEAFVYLDGKRLVMAKGAVLGGISDIVTSGVALQVAEWRTGVVFADRAALNATMKALSDSPSGRRKARTIAYLCRLPLNGQHAVLTDALAQRFVAPGATRALSTWQEAFHLKGASTPELLMRLATHAASGESTVIPDAVSKLRGHGKDAAFHLSKATSGAIEAYKAITRHGDLWSAVEHADPILRESYLRTGDTVAVEPFKMLGGIVEARVSTPFKIRPGSSVLVWRDGDRGLSATMVELGFDPEAEALTARFAKPATGKRRRNGYDVLFDALGSRGKGTGEVLYVTTEPFAGKAAPGGGHKATGSWTAGRSITRELPLFVSLAAAAAPQSTPSGGTTP